MKLLPRSFIFRFAVLFIITIISNISFAQWEADVQLTQNSFASYTTQNDKYIAAEGNYVHAVWYEDVGGYDIFYKRSVNSGESWEPTVRITNDSLFSFSPVIASSGGIVHIIWADNLKTQSATQLFYRRSTNSGQSWEPTVQLTNSSISFGGILFPAVYAENSVVHIIWRDERNGSSLYYRRSNNGGATWEGEIIAHDTLLIPEIPSISASGQNIHLTWSGGDRSINYTRSTNNGTNWSHIIQLDSSEMTSQGFTPSITTSGLNVHIVFTTHNNIYYRNSIDNGVSWQPIRILVINEGFATYPCLTSSGSKIHMSWKSYNKVFYKRSIDEGNTWSENQQLTFSPSYANYPSIAVTGSGVHILWTDARTGRNEIFYKRNQTGNVGIKHISSDISTSYQLRQNYPNPFNPNTKIRFNVPAIVNGQSSNVRLVVYDAAGKMISELVNARLSSGEYEVDFNASNLSSGIYFYELQSSDFRVAKKMILQK